MSPAMQEFYPVKSWNLDWELMSKKVSDKASWYWENGLWDVTKMVSYLLRQNLSIWMLQSKIDGMQPWRAQLETTEKLEWKGQKGFKDAKFSSVGESKWIKKSGKLAFVLLGKSCHEIEFTNRRDTFMLLERFLWENKVVREIPSDLISFGKVQGAKE
jgi:hypothetical protein